MDLANYRGSMNGCSLPGMKGRQSRGEARRTGANEPLFLDERCLQGLWKKRGRASKRLLLGGIDMVEAIKYMTNPLRP